VTDPRTLRQGQRVRIWVTGHHGVVEAAVVESGRPAGPPGVGVPQDLRGRWARVRPLGWEGPFAVLREEEYGVIEVLT
jgi:hypothetical protein